VVIIFLSKNSYTCKTKIIATKKLSLPKIKNLLISASEESFPYSLKSTEVANWPMESKKSFMMSWFSQALLSLSAKISS
jgi:hypothetical protein